MAEVANQRLRLVAGMAAICRERPSSSRCVALAWRGQGVGDRLVEAVLAASPWEERGSRGANFEMRRKLG